MKFAQLIIANSTPKTRTHDASLSSEWEAENEEDMNQRLLLCGFGLLVIGALSFLILQSAVVLQVLRFVRY